MDMYGISAARLHENELHQQASDAHSVATANFKTATQKFNDLQSGIIMPPAVFSLPSRTSIKTLSCNGLNFI